MPGWLRLYYSSGALARGFDGARRGALGRIDARLRCLVAMSAGGEDGCKPPTVAWRPTAAWDGRRARGHCLLKITSGCSRLSQNVQELPRACVCVGKGEVENGADDGAELESLKREVEYLRSEHVALGHEHRKEMNEKEGMLAKRLKRAEKAEQLVNTLMSSNRQQLRAANDQVEGSGLEIGHLKREVKLLRTRSAEAKVRVADLELALAKDPNAKLRFKIKALCLKYHPDKASATTLTSEEVARDLLELLQ